MGWKKVLWKGSVTNPLDFEICRFVLHFSANKCFLASRTGVAKLFEPRAEFATAWLVKGRIQCDLCKLCKNRLLKSIAVQ